MMSVEKCNQEMMSVETKSRKICYLTTQNMNEILKCSSHQSPGVSSLVQLNYHNKTD